jgi:hypothetical protein
VITYVLYDIPRISQKLGGGVGTDPRLLDHFQRSIYTQTNYYDRKWGGQYLSEMFTHPFNDPNIGANEWTLEEDKITKISPKEGI